MQHFVVFVRPGKCCLETLFWLNTTILKPKLIINQLFNTLIINIYFGG